MGKELIISSLSQSFEEAFSDHHGSARGTCQCGQEYYNPDGGWDWEEGELEALEKSNAIALDYSVPYMTINGREYIMGCKCNQELKPLENFLLNHQRQIAEYLTALAKRKIKSGEDLLKALPKGS